MRENQSCATEQTLMLHRGYSVCWSAIFAGVFIGAGLGFLLRLYGVAISLSAFSSAQHTASVIAVGGFVGMIIGVIAAMATAGFVSGYLGRHHYYPLHGGVIYGFITWSLILLISAVLTKPLILYTSFSGESLSAAASMEKTEGQINRGTPTENSNLSQANDDTNRTLTPLTTKQLVWKSWMIFILFFVGAISSCIGACYGMQCKREILSDKSTL